MIDQLRIMERQTKKREDSTHCDLCGGFTKKGKPFCTEHLGEMPYAQKVMLKLGQRDAELRAVSKRGSSAVVVDGIVAHEILGMLKIRGQSQCGRIAKEADISFKIFLGYVYKLKTAGLITQDSGGRGEGKISLA